MNMKFSIKRFGPAVLAFTLVVLGVLLVLPDDNDEVKANQDVPVVVAVNSLSSGATASQVRNNVEVRMVPETSRASGAISSIAELPDGALAYTHVAGQQILKTSFSVNQLLALGDGYVAVSIRVESQRWVGPYVMSGKSVNIYDTNITTASLISSDAVILGTPETEDLEPKQETIISLGVKQESLAAVLVAASEDRLWLVST
jgi:hypothetical protein